MYKRISESDKKRAIELYEKGELSNLEILKVCDINLKTLYKILDEAGVQKKKKRLDDAIDEVSVEMYRNGYTLKEIFERTGTNNVRLYKALDKEGVPRRKEMPTGRRGKTKEEKDEALLSLNETDRIIEMYVSGITRTKIAVELNIPYEKVKRIVELAIENDAIAKNEKECDLVRNREKAKKIADMIIELDDETLVVTEIAEAFHISHFLIYYQLRKAGYR